MGGESSIDGRGTDEPIVDESFGDFLNEIEPEVEAKPEEETSEEGQEEEQEQESEEEGQEEEESHEEQEDEEAVEEVEDDSQEAEEEEGAAPQEEEEEEVEYEEPDPRDVAIADLRREIDELKKDKPAPKEKEEPPPSLPDDLQQQIMGDNDLDDITSDPKLFTEVLARAITVGRDLTHEHIMKSIPNLVMQQTRGYQDLLRARKRFYSQNKDLRPFSEAVATAANGVHSEHPDWKMDRIMTEAAKRVRVSLKIRKKKSGKTPPGKKQTPAFANTPRGKKVKVKPSQLQKDINDVLDL